MTYAEEDWLLLSGLQHFAFCPRQWALIHIEQQWQENLRTAEGQLLHEQAHNPENREKRKDRLILRDLRVFSPTLGITGACDVVEFHSDPAGVELQGRAGKWLPFPVEYKRGKPKEHQADELQLCAQALCLEEMLCCKIEEGALFYGETRRRQPVLFTEALRAQVKDLLEQMHRYAAAGVTPRPKPNKGCNQCSMLEVCVPGLLRGESASGYLADAYREVNSCENC